MKKILLFVAALCLSSLSFAQTQVATLQHGDSISVFYNTNAFVDAYNAATTGDVISLSAGNFTVCSITKDSLTIRGAGMDQTFFTGNIGLSGSDTMHSITMEGVCFRNAVSQNCNLEVFYFSNVSFAGGYSVYNASTHSGQFVNCILNGYSPGSETTPTLINCLVFNIGDPDASVSTYINCVVWFSYASSYYVRTVTNFVHANFVNSILICYGSRPTYGSSNCTLTTTALAQNCIGIKESDGVTGNNFFSSCVSQNCRMVNSSVFSDFNLGTLNPERYILTDSAQAAYLGIDGSQVGLYGGYVPYSSNLKYPVITRMNVSNQTTADGRLSVDIQVGYTPEEDDDNE